MLHFCTLLAPSLQQQCNYTSGIFLRQIIQSYITKIFVLATLSHIFSGVLPIFSHISFFLLSPLSSPSSHHFSNVIRSSSRMIRSHYALCVPSSIYYLPVPSTSSFPPTSLPAWQRVWWSSLRHLTPPANECLKIMMTPISDFPSLIINYLDAHHHLHKTKDSWRLTRVWATFFFFSFSWIILIF